MKNLSGCKGMLCGRTPVLWEKKMALTVTWLNDLRRDSSWIEGWVAGVNLKLCQESLTGSCLAELVGSASVGKDSGQRGHLINKGSILAADTFSFIRDAKTGKLYGSPSLSDSGDKYSTGDMLQNDDLSDHQKWIDLSGGYNRWHSMTYRPGQESGIEAVRPGIFPGSSSSTSEKTRKSMPRLMVSGEVNRDLLTRLAGVFPSLEAQPQNRPIIWPSMQNKAVSSMHFGNTPSHQSWLKNLADTAAQAFYRAGTDQISAIPMSDQRMSDQRISPVPISDHRLSPDVATSLYSQWKTVLSGSRFPSHLLEAIVAKASIMPSKTNQPDHNLQKYPPTEAAGVDQSVIPFAKIPDHASSDRNTTPALKMDNFSFSDHENQKLSGSRSEQTRATIDPVDPVRHSNRDSQITQSSDSMLFPPLPSSHENSGHSVSAPEVSGDSNHKGLINSEEDIVALAAKIKQILDDEARRYGINV